MKDDFGDDDKRNPIKLCLASASLHQHRSPAAVGLWLWRKQQIRDKGKREMDHVVWQSSYYWGFPHVHMKEQCWLLCPGRFEPVSPLRKGLTLMSGSMKLTPDLHDAKHFAGYSNLRNNSYFTLISSIRLPSRSSSTSEQVSFFIKQYLRVPAQGGGGHF